ncbi:unnamed protein product [Albugo candida]|uniref:Uncharacterized protein n=1 Tax=Albugo candida TaxID=65357 RepID=A0A024FU15_9STRA|nr:unnamed protein product [Albugo candida]|eukprot:CCI10615.1 unnamed protein product [Albugo candida]
MCITLINTGTSFLRTIRHYYRPRQWRGGAVEIVQEYCDGFVTKLNLSKSALLPLDQNQYSQQMNRLNT